MSTCVDEVQRVVGRATGFADDLGPAAVVLLRNAVTGVEAIVVVDNVAAGPAIGKYAIPCSASIGAANAHMFVPPRSFQPSPQVSLNGSPAFGTVWNSQTLAPVRTSNARGLPAGPCGTSPLAAPMIAMLR